jgi:arylsulfatase A-like enzyme
VVVITTDDQAVDTMKAMPLTRRAIGGNGVTFTQSIVSFPLCCPSRASFLTGQYSHNNGVQNNHPPHGGFGALDGDHILPLWLERAGYRTALVGKYLNGYGKNEFGGRTFIPPGWTDWYAEARNHRADAFDYSLNENGKLVDYGHDPRDYKTDVLSRLSTSVIRRYSRSPRPFFLWITPSAPHQEGLPKSAPRNPEPAPRDVGAFGDATLPPSPAFNERDVKDKPRWIQKLPRLDAETIETTRRTYISQLEALRAVDRMVQRVTQTLRSSGELGRTVIIFTSDNGFLRGQHRIPDGKIFPYEESIGVPLLIRGPGFPSGARTSGLAANIDLAPTILQLTGARADIPVDGRSLIPVARDRKGSANRAVVLEVFGRNHSYRGLRTERYVYLENAGDRDELYDLRRDPAQLDNVIGQSAYAAVRARLGEHLQALEYCSGQACR